MGDDMTVKELAAARARGEAPVMLDVREPFELAIARIEGAIAIPMGTVPDRLGELERTRPLVVICHTGRRSGAVCEYLRAQGFTNVHNLKGGIEAWSREVDPSVPRY